MAAKSIAPLLANPTRVVGILLYGADVGLVRERSQRAVRAVLGHDRDAFRLTVLPREEHGRLREELASLPLGGGRRVLRVLDATDGLAAVLEATTVHADDMLVILEAGVLTPRAKLRSMAERGPTWAAVPCFPDMDTVVGEVTQTLALAGVGVTPDALTFLAAELGGDFARRHSELEKLALFAGDAGVVDFAQATASCVGQIDASVGLAVHAALAGDPAGTDRILGELEREGATGPGLLAVLSAELQRLLKVRAEMERGSTVEAACRSLVPPIYPRQAASFAVAVRRWPLAKLLWLGEVIRSADQACKRAGARDFTIATCLLSTIARGRTGL